MINMASIKKEPKGEADYLKPYSASQDLKTLNDKDTGELVEELRLCLPIWATRDQMLHLLTISRGDIVEATSEFYERETEFYEQVPASYTKIENTLVTTTATKNDCVVHPKSPVKEVSHQSSINIPSLDSKLSTLTNSSKGAVSSNKRGSVSDKKSKKKVKTTSASDSSGSKQAAITKFFKKQDSALPSTGSLQPAITKFFKKTVPENSQATKD